ncbi:MAG: FtsX-like permease family protein, partial [Eubacterium sp.]
MLETFIIGIFSLFAGLILGLFLSQGLAVMTAKMFETTYISFQFVFSPSACGKTIVYFGLMFLLVMIFNSISISKYKLIDLLSADKTLAFRCYFYSIHNLSGKCLCPHHKEWLNGH